MISQKKLISLDRFHNNWRKAILFCALQNSNEHFPKSTTDNISWFIKGKIIQVWQKHQIINYTMCSTSVFIVNFENVFLISD